MSERSPAGSTCSSSSFELLKEEGLLQRLKELDEPRCFSTTVDAWAKDYRWRDALEAMNSLRPQQIQPSVASSLTATRGCGKSDQWQHTHAVIAEKKNDGLVSKDTAFYEHTMLARRKSGQADTLGDLLSQFAHSGGRPRSASFPAMQSSTKSIQWQLALELFGSMLRSGTRPDVTSFNATLEALTKGGRWQSAVDFFGEAASYNVQPDNVSYVLAMDAASKGGLWKTALSLMSEIQMLDTVPDHRVCYNLALHACCKGGYWAEAIELLNLMAGQGLDPDVNSYNSAINACSHGSKWEEAVGILRKMKQTVQPNLLSFNAALHGCNKCGKWHMALGLLEEMTAQGLQPNASSYREAVDACGKLRWWDKAVRLIHRMRSEGVQPHQITFNTAIHASVKTQDLEMAVTLFLEALTALSNYGNVAGAAAATMEARRLEVEHFFQTGQHRKAINLYYEMHRAGLLRAPRSSPS
jgi:pentatricopeptide repeat domain-containing protein 1